MTIEKKERIIQRLLEIFPGFVAWNLILFTVWGGLVIPVAVAYFVLAFNVFWFYKSISLAIFAVVAHFRIEASKKMDWIGEIKGFPDYKKVHHIVVVCTYKEPYRTIERTLQSIADQTLPKDQISVVVGFEIREAEEARKEKTAEILRNFRGKFANLIINTHTLVLGETAGKHSNARVAVINAKEQLVDRGKVNMAYAVVTSCDADHVYHPNHFACLTFKFLDDPHRYERFWQPAIVFYNNFWKLPAITRVANTFGSIWNMAQLVRTDRLINQQNYALSLKLLDQIGYWDKEVIPEDWHMFFKAFFTTGGKVEVVPIYLPLSADAAESTTFFKTLVNQYEQYKRWAWGVSDDPYVIKNFFLSKKIHFGTKVLRTLRLLEDHFLWPVNWFIITLGVNLPALVNPAFGKTALGYSLPKISSGILTACLLFLAIVLIVDSKQRPARPKEVSRFRALLVPFEFVLMPIVGFFFAALPGLDAHTRLMLGKYMEYRVTEKV